MMEALPALTRIVGMFETNGISCCICVAKASFWSLLPDGGDWSTRPRITSPSVACCSWRLHQIVEGVDGNRNGGANLVLEVEGLEPNLLKALCRLGDEVQESVLARGLAAVCRKLIRWRPGGRWPRPSTTPCTLPTPTADLLARVRRDQDVLQTGDEAEMPGVVGVKVPARLFEQPGKLGVVAEVVGEDLEDME